MVTADSKNNFHPIKAKTYPRLSHHRLHVILLGAKNTGWGKSRIMVLRRPNRLYSVLLLISALFSIGTTISLLLSNPVFYPINPFLKHIGENSTRGFFPSRLIYVY